MLALTRGIDVTVYEWHKLLHAPARHVSRKNSPHVDVTSTCACTCACTCTNTFVTVKVSFSSDDHSPPSDVTVTFGAAVVTQQHEVYRLVGDGAEN